MYEWHLVSKNSSDPGHFMLPTFTAMCTLTWTVRVGGEQARPEVRRIPGDLETRHPAKDP